MSEAAKRAAGAAAADLVEAGMTVGLGTGSTAHWFIAALAERVAAGLDVRGVPSSQASADQARAAGIKVVALPVDGVDLDVDGADQVDPDLRLIKGGGGAHVRERIVALSASRFVVIVDSSKLVARLHGPLPLEILEFGAERTRAAATEIAGGSVVWRQAPDGAPLRSDNSNLLADCELGEIGDAEGLAAELDALAGVVGHGLFLGMADLVMVGAVDATLQLLQPSR